MKIAKQISTLSIDQLKFVAKTIKERDSVKPVLVRQKRSERLVLSYAQERLWFFEQLGLSACAYNMPMAMHLQGPLDVRAFEQAIAELVRRHESLRTHFRMSEGVPYQVITDPGHYRPEIRDLSTLEDSERQAKALFFKRDEAQRQFDLSTGPLFRVLLLRLASQEHVLLLTMHHIISDGWSIGVLIRELSALYYAFSRGEIPALPEIPIQYADYAIWQRQWLRGEVLHKQLSYWCKQLDGAPPLLELPTDRPRPTVASFNGAAVSFQLPEQLCFRLRQIAREEGVTLYMLVLAAFQVLLARYTGQKDIVVGSPIAGRTHQETDGVIGFFVNTLALRADLSGGPSFLQLLGQVKETTLAAYAYQDLPFERLVAELQPERDLSRHPLFQVYFALQGFPEENFQFPGIVCRPMSRELVPVLCDLSLGMREAGVGLSGVFDYSTDLFDRSTVERLADHFKILLEGIVETPACSVFDIRCLSEAERKQQLLDWNSTELPYPRERCIHEIFADQVARTPDAIAVICEDRRLTYRELDVRSNQLAHHLRSLGVKPEEVVGVCVERSLELLVGILGILKAGAAYLPLDPNYPDERLKFVVEDSQATIVLVQHGTDGFLNASGVHRVYLDEQWSSIARQPCTSPLPSALASNLAYIMYTSGSTGVPKGVEVEHRSVVSYMLDIAARFDLQSSDRFLQFASISFDVAAEEILPTLSRGAAVVLVRDPGRLSSREFLSVLAQYQITCFEVPTAFWHQLAYEMFTSRLELPACVRLAIIGGESMSPDRLRMWRASGGGRVHSINIFGLTEVTITSAMYRVTGEESPIVPIGRPIANTSIYILDDNLQPVPIGVSGRLYIGGVGVARGYAGKPGLTASRFIPNPFSASPGERLYDTGDQARFRADGNVVFIQRLDEQVKVRGFRIEPAEIESELRACPDVLDCSVQACVDAAGEKYLVAYLVSAGQSPLDGRAVREYLKGRLPSHMIPSSFVLLPSIPLTANGKVDKQALPWPSVEEIREGEYRSPESAVEHCLADICQELLGVHCVGMDDNFFELGGHSLLAMRMIGLLRETLGIELPLRVLFEVRTIGELGARIEERQQQDVVSSRLPLIPQHRDERPVLSYPQERLWFLEQLGLTGPAYNVALAVRLEGRLELQALQQTFNELMRRHESLRTRFPASQGMPYQVVDEPGMGHFEIHDLSKLEKTERSARVHAIMQRERLQRFDLSTDRLFRVCLLSLSDQEHVLVVTMHHIICDGWSTGILIRELNVLYDAYVNRKTSPLGPLPVQYADYAIWQRTWLHERELEKQLSYWREQLLGAPPVLCLPLDRPRPQVASYRGAALAFSLSNPLSAALVELSRREGVTLYMLLLAAFKTLLSRWSGQEDVVVGTQIAGRTQRQTEPLIGLFLNTLALRTNLSGNPSFRELLKNVKEVTLGAYAHQDLPFERLVQDLQPERSLSHQPVFQVQFVYQNDADEQWQLPGLTVSQLNTGQHTTAQFEVSLHLLEESTRIRGFFEYASDLFDAGTIDRFARQFRKLLEGIVENPQGCIGQFPLLSPEERNQLLSEWNDTATTDWQDRCIHELFAAQAARTPQAVAVICGDHQLTYKELDERSNQLAHHLITFGVGPEIVVGLCLERSVEMIISLLGVLKAGGTYLPLDPAYPTERLEFMLSDANASVLLMHSALSDRLAQRDIPLPRVYIDEYFSHVTGLPSGVPVSCVCPNNLAYVLYTSGSTGVPKGVMIRHSALVNFLISMAQMLKPCETDAIAALTPLSFDIAALEIFLPLLHGARVAVLPRPGTLDSSQLREQLQRFGVSLIQATPSLWRMLYAPDWKGNVRQVLSGGEALSLDQAARLTNLSNQVWNLYGPTETTVWSTAGRVVANSAISIGRPIANTQVYVLNEELEPVPIGVAGELYIGGKGLARGYVGRPGLTSERFIANPFGQPGERMYRTGDRVRWLAHGELEFLGRLDTQIKLRGYRIEPGEVEAALLKYPGIKQALVVLREDEPGDQRLVGYVVVEGGGGQQQLVNPLREHLKERLPIYMVPTAWVVLATLPLTPNGKVDRSKLPVPESCLEASEQVAPRTAQEEALGEIWAQVLRVERVGVHDNFFELGGHSLLAARVVARVREILGVELPIRTVFESPTIATMSEQITIYSGVTDRKNSGVSLNRDNDDYEEGTIE